MITVVPVSGVTTHMIDPISEQVVRTLINKLQINDFIKTNIYPTADHLTSSKTEDNSTPILSNNRFDYRINYSLEPNRVKYDTNSVMEQAEYGLTKYHIGNMENVFIDVPNRFSIREHTSAALIELECTISCLERTAANDIFNVLVNTHGSARPIMLTNVVFDYPLPDETRLLLTYVYLITHPDEPVRNISELLQNSSPGLIEYMASKSMNKIGMIFNKNLEKPRSEYVINKNEMELGFEVAISDIKPQAAMVNKSVNHYTISFTLTGQFSRPNLLYQSYPIIIKNNLIHRAFLPTDILTREGTYYNSIHPYIDMALGHNEFKQAKTIEPFRQPFYDDFDPMYPNFRLLKYVPFYIAATPIDTINPVTTIDLSSNLGSTETPIRIKQSVLDILFNQGIHAFDCSLSIVIGVFADDVLIEPATLLYVNNTITIPNRDINKAYHVVLYENTEVTGNVPALRVLKCDLITN